MLRRLEQKYADVLVVVGVHSPKFPEERETANLRQAIARLGVEHPVVNDRDYAVWQRYAVRAWPTLVFLDPAGKVIGQHAGEMPFEALDNLVGQLVAAFDAAGQLSRAPLPLRPEPRPPAAAPLHFPGKIVADAANERLFIADSGHHRIVITDLIGTIRQIIGEGRPGLRDGTFESVLFNNPQGLALVDDRLYVADTDNHAIRLVDLTSESVFTIAGTGEQAMRFHTGGRARSTPLSSPWDLTHHAGSLFIAMAGFHQIWRLDLASGEIVVFAGSGHEGIQDGPRHRAWFAQPSGIVNDGARLFVACSETSAIRVIDLAGDGLVRTIVGVGLFEFGDVDGIGDAVRLQHPLGLDWHDGVLSVADTYNSKIKRLDPATRVCRTIAGGGDGFQDGPAADARFDEPGGLCFAAGKLYLADTNNHAIRVLDLATGMVSTLTVRAP